MAKYIEPEFIENLRKYKYSGVDKSLLAKHVLQPYWNWLVTLFPTSLAPNMITLLGFLCIVANFLTMLYYTTDISQPLPNWCYFSFAIGLFVYQSLDAIDGKQARRTGTSSPLGELFDHGCDALNCTLGFVLGANALNLGASWMAVLSLLSSTANFYLTTWEEYHTGTLFLGLVNGPDEGVLTLVAVYIWTGFVGPQWWSQNANKYFQLPAWFPALQINELIICFAISMVVFALIASIRNTIIAVRQQKKSVLVALTGLFPFIFQTIAIVAWLEYSPHIFQKHFITFAMFITFAFGNVVGRIIVAHVVNQEFPHFNINLALLGLGAALSVSHKYYPLLSQQQEILYLRVIVAVAFIVHAHFVLEVINDICLFLNINCLTIKRKTPAETEMYPKNATPVRRNLRSRK